MANGQGYWRKLWKALRNRPDPVLVFGLEEAWRILTSPNMAKYEQAEGELAEAIATTQVAMAVGFSGAKVTVAEEVDVHIQAQNERIEAAETSNQRLQEDLDLEIAAIKRSKEEANQITQEEVASCTAEVLRAARVEKFLAPVLAAQG